MTLETYLVFVGASIVLCIVPGPDMIFLLSRAIAQGRRAGVMAAFGINLGAYVHLAAAVLGISAVLMTSAVAFTAMKWAGAAYLVWLGVQALFAKASPLVLDTGGARRTHRAIFWQGFVSDVLNPKVAMFFLALLPQFIAADAESPLAQLVLLGLTVNVIGIATNLSLVWLSSGITGALRGNPAIARWLHKAMGAVFIYLGLRLVTEKA